MHVCDAYEGSNSKLLSHRETWVFEITNQWRIEDIPEEGAPAPEGGRQPIIWPIFFRKLHEIEEISDRLGGGDARSSRPPPLDPPLQ